MIPAPPNANKFNLQHSPSHQNSALLYGMASYNHVHHQHPITNCDLAVAPPYYHYGPYMAHPAVHDQLPLPGSHGIDGYPMGSYVGTNLCMDGVEGPFKWKNAAGTPGNMRYTDAFAGPSSSTARLSAGQLQVDATSRAASSVVPSDGGENDTPSFIENGSDRNSYHLTQGNYAGFQLPGNTWVDPRFVRNVGNLSTHAWNRAANVPYSQGYGLGGYAEVGNLAIQSYQVPSPPPIPQGYPYGHHPPFAMQGMRGHYMNFPSQVTASPHNLATHSSANGNIIPFQGFVEARPQYFESVPPTGFGFYQRDTTLQGSSRQRNLPLRVLPEDGVAMLEVPNNHGVGDSTDQLREMRLDIDDMSYEELLALGEQIGSVGSGLSEEAIISQVKTKSFVSSSSFPTFEDSTNLNQEISFCVICQTNYEDQEKIGTLECGHEYHMDCLKSWLIVKNSCPICKSTALTSGSKDLNG